MSCCFRCDKKSESVKNTSDTETTNSKNLPHPNTLAQGAYTVHDDCGCKKTVVIDENGNATIVNDPADQTDPNATPDKPQGLIDSVWDYISKWVKNADIFDWAKAILALAGIIYYGAQLISQMSNDGSGGSSSHGFNGSPAYSGGYTKPTLQEVVKQLCVFADVPHDVSELSSDPVEFTIGNNTSARTMLEQLSKVYNFDIIQTTGIMRFRHRYANDVADATINLSDMGFSGSMDNLPDRITTKRLQGIDLPKSISFTYFSGTTAQEPFTQIAKLPAYVEGQNISLNIPITLDHQKAKDTAETLLMAAHIERSSYKFNTSYKYIHIEPGDIIFNDNVGNIRITKIVEQSEGILEFEAVNAGIEDSLAAVGSAPMLPHDTGPNVISGGPIILSGGIFIDPPFITGEDIGQTRIYGVIHGYGNASWQGAKIYVSKNGGTTYNTVTSAATQSTFGICSSGLAGYSNFSQFDLASSISVTLKTGSLNSVTDVELNDGANQAYIGRELIAFGVATLTGEKTYTLSRLKRGLSGTEQFANNHIADELFAMKNELYQINFAEQDIGTEVKIKVVTNGQDISTVDAQDVGVASNNFKLWQPKNGAFVKTGNDYNFTWDEAIRKPNSLNPTADLHDIDWTSFAIGVYDTNSNLKGKRVIVAKNWTYTAALQLSDFGSLPTHFSISVVPISLRHGNGYPLTITV